MAYDIIIIGGGLVGSSLGLALAQRGFRIAIIEAIEPNHQQQPSFDSKAIALSHSSYNIFNQIRSGNENLWRKLAPHCNAIKSIHVSEQQGFGFTRLHSNEVDVPAMGYVIENRDLGMALIDAVNLEKHVDYLCPYQLRSIETGSDGINVVVETMDNRERLSARLVVAADGGNSRTRELLSIGTREIDYRQNAIITTVQCQRPHNDVAYERFTQQGPLAFLPLSDNRCSIVWTQKPESTAELLGFSDTDFIQRLQSSFGRRLGRILRVGKRFSFPLIRVTAQSCVAERSVLIGNAAHTLHPIAGQGFNLGLRDVSALTEVLTQAANQGRDIGNPDVLQEYQLWQGKDQDRIIQFTHGLLNIFSNPLLPLKVLRNSGLILMDIIPPVKKRFTRRSMGLAGRMSLMARGVALPRLRTKP